MLKYSFMTFACPEYSLDEVIAAAVRYGYDGVEPRAVEGHRHGVELERTPAERAVIRRQFEDAGVAVACVATSIQFNQPEPAQRRAMVDLTKAYCALAADIGAQRIRVFCGHGPHLSDHDTVAMHVGECLDACAETAAETGVFICLETHDFFCAGADVAAVCRAVDSPWIRATWDTQHPVTVGEDMDVTASLLMPYVEHVHFHDVDRMNGRNECVPIGEGQTPIGEFLALFQKHGYGGFVSGEWFYNNGSETDIAHYIHALRSIEKAL